MHVYRRYIRPYMQPCVSLSAEYSGDDGSLDHDRASAPVRLSTGISHWQISQMWHLFLKSTVKQFLKMFAVGDIVLLNLFFLF